MCSLEKLKLSVLGYTSKLELGWVTLADLMGVLMVVVGLVGGGK